MEKLLLKFSLKFSDLITWLFFLPASTIVLTILFDFDTPFSYIKALAVSIFIRFIAAGFTSVFFLRKHSDCLLYTSPSPRDTR